MLLTLNLNVSERLLMDILTTAVEGGINYWLQLARDIERDTDLSVLRVVGPLELDDVTIPIHKNIDLFTVLRGIELVLRAEVAPKRNDIRGALLRAIADPDEADLDAEAADVIVQAGLFGEVIYG